MKKPFLICCLCTLSLILFGCAQQTEDKIDLQSMSAAEVLGELIEADFPIYEQIVLTAETDPQKLLGTPHNYSSKAEWLDRRAGSLNNKGILIEVFNNSADCKAHKEKFDQMYSMLSSVRYYSFQEGKVLMGIQCNLTAGQVAEYEAAFKAMAQGNMPESPTDGTTYNIDYTNVVAKYYDLAYDIYLSMDMQDMSDVLDMASIQNQNFVAALEANTIYWDYSIQKGYTIDTRERYPLYYDIAKIEKTGETVIVTVDISGDNTQAYPPFVVFGENKFVLKQIEDTWLITQHDYIDTNLFEVSKTEKIDFELDKVRMKVDEEYAGAIPQN